MIQRNQDLTIGPQPQYRGRALLPLLYKAPSFSAAPFLSAWCSTGFCTGIYKYLFELV